MFYKTSISFGTVIFIVFGIINIVFIIFIMVIIQNHRYSIIIIVVTIIIFSFVTGIVSNCGILVE